MAFVSTKIDKLDSGLTDADVRVLVLSCKENGISIRTLYSQTAGLKVILERAQLNEGAWAVRRATLVLTN